jgi:hypothetical protein
VLGELKELLATFPGDCDVVVELSTSVGKRRLRLGHDFRVTRSSSLHAELHALLGSAMLPAAAPAVEAATAVAGA